MIDKYSEALVVTLVRSRLTLVLGAFATLATLGVLVLTPLPLRVRILMAAWVCCAALWALRTALRTPTVFLDSSGRIAVDGRPGSVREACFVAPFLTVIRWRPEGALLDRSLLVAPDALDAAHFRHLRVLVKWGRTL